MPTDVHAAVDHVIDLGLADPDRLGVMGLSYGGFMVNWLVGTTDRFKAAVSENGVTNQVSDWANSDSGPEYDRASLLGDPFTPEGIDKLWRQSPLRNVSASGRRCSCSRREADLRCPPQDNEQLFIALRHLRRDGRVRPLPGRVARVWLVAADPTAGSTATSASSPGSTGTCAADRAWAPGPQTIESSGRGVVSCRVAARWPARAARRNDAAVDRPPARLANQPTRNPAVNASPAPVVSAAVTCCVATSKRSLTRRRRRRWAGRGWSRPLGRA